MVSGTFLSVLGILLGGGAGFWLGRRRGTSPMASPAGGLEHLQEARMDAIGTFSAGMAHEFNNLLTAINGHTQLARECPDLSRDVQADLEAIGRAGGRAAALVQRMLGAGHPNHAEPQAIDVTGFLTQVLPSLRASLAPETDLVLERIENLPAIKADAGQLEMCLLALVARAGRAIASHPEPAEAGRVTISVRTVVVTPDTLPRQAIGRYVEIAVSDNGMALDDAALERLFEPDFTKTSPPHEVHLDLAQVWSLTRLAGGTVHARVVPGGGTEIALVWPALVGHEMPRQDTLPVARDDESVLLLEDDPGLRGLVSNTLMQLGYRLMVVRSSWEVLTLLRERRTRFDIVICELVQPGLGGQQLTDEARRLDPEQRLLILSPVSAPTWPDHDPEVVGFLVRPFAPRQLAQMVRTLIDGRARATQSHH